MSQIKAHIDRHHLGWIIADCFGEREMVSLADQCGILDRRREITILKSWFANDLATCFFNEAVTEKMISQHLGKKAEEAARRIQYMSVEEIQIFLSSVEQLQEDGEFGEILWALLMDAREAVQQHGYRLLAEHERSLPSIPRLRSEQASQDFADEKEEDGALDADSPLLLELVETYYPQEPSPQTNLDTDPSLSMFRELERHKKQLEKLQKTITNLRSEYASLQSENEKLNQKITELSEENRELKSRERRYQESELHNSELERENKRLRQELEKFSDQLCEFHGFQVEKEKIAAELKSVEEIAGCAQQTLERMRSNFEAQFAHLQRINQEYKSALIQARRKASSAAEQRRAAGANRVMVGQPRIGVFVDVQNMFYAAKDRYSRRLDYIKLLDLIVGPRNLVVAYAYVVQIPEINQSGFLSLLEHNGYTIKSKDLRMRGDGSAKGDWDVGIAVDVVAMLDGLDVVILASGDGDFCALAEIVKRRGKRIEVVAFEHNTSLDLQRIADQFHPIGDDMLI